MKADNMWCPVHIVGYNIDREIFIEKKFSLITLNNKNETDKRLYSMNKWSKFIMSSAYNDKYLTRRIF